MNLNLIKKQMRIKAHKKHALNDLIVAMLFTAVVVASSIVFINAENHSLTKYWTDNGQADIIAVYSSDDVKVMNEAYDTADSVSYANIAETVCANSSGNNEIPAIIAETDVKELNQKFNIGMDDLQAGEVLVNLDIIERLDCAVGDLIVIDNRKFTISGVTDAVNFVSSNTPIIISNNIDNVVGTEANHMISFIDYQHDSRAVNASIEILNKNSISYINQFEGSQTIVNEFADLNSILNILVLAVFIICFVLVLTSFSLAIKNESSYWASIRMIGISQKRMVKNILLENALFSFVGSILGGVLSFFIAKIICILTDTMFDYQIINWPAILGFVVAGILVVMLPILFVLLKQTRKEVMRPFADKKPHNKRHHAAKILTAFIFAILFAAAAVTSNLWARFLSLSRPLIYAIKLILLLIALVLFVVVLIDCVPIIAKKMHGKSMQLMAYSIKNHSTRIKGITISLVICVTMLGSLIDFSASYKMWATELATQQLTFDARITANNDNIGLEQIKLLKESGNIQPEASYYLDTGKLSNLPVYIISEFSESRNLNDLYGCDTSFNSLKKMKSYYQNS